MGWYMADKLVPIIYVGGKPEWKDHLYKTGLVFKKDEITLVPGYAYERFLTHPEFKDGRIGKMKAREVDTTQPQVEVEKDEAPLVNLEAMSKENLAMYAKRNFNLELQMKYKKSELIETIRRQMGTEMPVGAFR